MIGTYASKKLTLEWTALNDSSITKYQYSLNGSNWLDITCAGSGCPQGTPMSHTLNQSLTFGREYTYQVRGFTATNTTVAVTGLKVWEEISTSATATSHTAVGLTSGTTYKFQPESGQLNREWPRRDGDAGGAGGPVEAGGIHGDVQGSVGRPGVDLFESE